MLLKYTGQVAHNEKDLTGVSATWQPGQKGDVELKRAVQLLEFSKFAAVEEDNGKGVALQQESEFQPLALTDKSISFLAKLETKKVLDGVSVGGLLSYLYALDDLGRKDIMKQLLLSKEIKKSINDFVYKEKSLLIKQHADSGALPGKLINTLIEGLENVS